MKMWINVSKNIAAIVAGATIGLIAAEAALAGTSGFVTTSVQLVMGVF